MHDLVNTQQSSRIAATVFAIYLAGTLSLPIADFSGYRDLPDPTVPVIGNALAFENPLNRGLVLGVGVLVVAGLMRIGRAGNPSLTHRVARGGPSLTRRVGEEDHSLARLDEGWFHSLARRVSAWDAIFLLWVAVPLLTGVLNPSPIRSDAWQSLYLAMVWGGPYLAARFICRSEDDLRGCLWLVLILGGLSAVPAIAEMIAGRFVYRDLYGYHPFQEIGATRWFGYRPLLCFEDPNQVAMWWMTVAMAAVVSIPQWTAAPSRSSSKWAALALPFLFQGIGATILTVVGVVVLNTRKVMHWKIWLGSLSMLAALLFLARGPLLRSAREVARSAGIEEVVRGVVRDSSLQSLGWRLAREEQGSTLLSEHPAFGWGSVMFWNNAEPAVRPWGLLSLVTGAYGLVGTGIFVACFLLPLLISLFHAPCLDRSDTAGYVQVGVPLLVALHAVDATMNPAFFLPVLFLFGAWVGARRRIEN